MVQELLVQSIYCVDPIGHKRQLSFIGRNGIPHLHKDILYIYHKTAPPHIVEMHRLCSHYHDMANKLRDQAYGYETSLDIVLPYNAKFTLEPVGKHLWGIQGFADKLCEYDTSLPSEANPTYPQALTAEDYTFMQSMTICIVYYLHSECKKTDYTFLGCIKLLKTFLGEIIDLEELFGIFYTFFGKPYLLVFLLIISTFCQSCYKKVC